MFNIGIEFLDINEDEEYIELVNDVLKECYIKEKIINLNLYIGVTLTNNYNIKMINAEYREIDKETDVLSFPILEKQEIDNIVENRYEDEEILGDIVVSIAKVEEQAKEYGHSFKREFAYMLVHGFYHLMGYDHIYDLDRKIMRQKEEEILKVFNLNI